MSDHDREWIIGCIKHDGFIKTDRFDKANHIILDALEKNIDAEIARLSRPTDYISRSDAIDAVMKHKMPLSIQQEVAREIDALPSADAEQGYTEWLEKIIVYNGSNEWLCEDTPDMEWCEKNCHYSSIQAECLRHLYEVRKGGAE